METSLGADPGGGAEVASPPLKRKKNKNGKVLSKFWFLIAIEKIDEFRGPQKVSTPFPTPFPKVWIRL